jgi:CBS domain-containing protein
MKERIKFLKSITPFDMLPDNVLSEVAQLMNEQVFEKEETIYVQDKSELKSIDILMQGQYDALFFDNNNIIRLEEHYTKGLIYGGGSVLLNKKFSIRTVIAKPGTRVLTFDKEEFKAL